MPLGTRSTGATIRRIPITRLTGPATTTGGTNGTTGLRSCSTCSTTRISRPTTLASTSRSAAALLGGPLGGDARRHPDCDRRRLDPVVDAELVEDVGDVD